VGPTRELRFEIVDTGVQLSQSRLLVGANLGALLYLLL
jgi:hypothetical protein